MARKRISAGGRLPWKARTRVDSRKEKSSLSFSKRDLSGRGEEGEETMGVVKDLPGLGTAS